MMLAGLQQLGGLPSSIGSNTTNHSPDFDESRGALTSGPIMFEASKALASPAIQGVANVIARYGQLLITTTSAHTIIRPLIVPTLTIEDREITRHPVQHADRSVPAELHFIEVLTGLPKVRIAEDLLGVSRQAHYDWCSGKPVSIENETRIRGTLDVLRRASVRHPTPEYLRAWLTTPVGSHAVIPMHLLKAGLVDEARLIAMSSLPRRDQPLPDWLQSGEINAWSERDLKRRSVVMRESDSIMSKGGPSDPDSVIP